MVPGAAKSWCHTASLGIDGSVGVAVGRSARRPGNGCPARPSTMCKSGFFVFVWWRSHRCHLFLLWVGPNFAWPYIC
jgi:hypothetical protein